MPTGVVSLETFLITDTILVHLFLKMQLTKDVQCSILVVLENLNVLHSSTALVRAKSNVILIYVMTMEWIPGFSAKYARNLLITLVAQDLEL